MNAVEKMGILGIVAVILFCVMMAVGWVKNICKLASCDFQAPYKAEVVHTVGLVPAIGGITGWLDMGK